MTDTVNAIWIGERMGPLHAACLQSFLDVGHKVVLHAYNKVEDAPTGVEYFDANKILPESQVVRHKETGSLALASDIYRYRILKNGLGTYVDCDVYCLRPLPDNETLLGKQDGKLVGSAILRLPKDHPALDLMIGAANDPHFIPWWYASRRQRRLRIRRALGWRTAVSNMEWGVIGPNLVSASIERSSSVETEIQPIDVFYPLHWQNAQLLNDPSLTLADLCTSRTVAVHLWSSLLPKELSPGSVADRIAAGHAPKAG